jgi:type IV secretory pathway TrbF-like protein
MRARIAPDPRLTPPRSVGLVSDVARIARGWRRLSAALLVLLALLGAAYVRLAGTSRVESQVVLVDELGRAELLGPAQELPDAERDRVVRAELGLLIRNLRSVYPDRWAQAELLRRAYAFLAPEAAAWADAYFAETANDPRTLAKDLSREVRVRSVLRVPRTDAWRVQWVEVETPRGAGMPRATAWEAYLAVREQPPATPEEAAANPLGLKVTAVNWTPVTQEDRS